MLRRSEKVACLALCVGATLVANETLAADWQVAPSAYIGTSYADNPRLVPDGGISSAGAVGELSTSIRRLTERSDLSVTPRLLSARYSDDATLDSDDQFINTEYRWLSERSEWAAELGLTRDTTLTSELGLTGLVQANRRHEAITVSAGPTLTLTERVALGAQLSWLDHHYIDTELTGLVDYSYSALSVFSNYAISDRSSITVSVQGGELTSAGFGATATRDAALRLSFSYQPYDVWKLSLSAGPSYADSAAGSDTGAIFEFEAKRQAQRWSLSTLAGRSLTPTGRGVMMRRDRLSASFNRSLTERLSATAGVQWIRSEDLLPQLGVATYYVDYARLDLGGNWRVGEHWSVALRLTANTQDYESNSRRAEGYRALLSMVWNGQPHSL